MADVATDLEPTPKYLKDYRPPDFLIESVDLDFQLDEANTEVEAKLVIRRNPATGGGPAPLVLHGRELTLLAICMDGQRLPEPRYAVDAESLTIEAVPERFTLDIITRIRPDQNTALEGLYVSNHIFCTQCEAEGFRKITYFLDRPDVMARYRTRIEADKAASPVLLANGNKIDGGDLPRGRHFAVWEDPFPKPAYLFALVAGRLAVLEDRFVTRSGREVLLQIYTEPQDIDKCDHAMESLKRSMRWDEDRFGLEYDLDQFMIVAIGDFNMGAMENKGLNVFNTKYILARPETATDTDFLGIERVIGHEYFHNWTGNRVTCRDWFQLSLKEGLTVFRDQEFTSDLHSRGVKRIDDVKTLRAHQFLEDAGPLAHPVRPESYVEINNFYTTTVYEKGAEVVRMIHTLVGEDAFQRGMALYVERHDGEAVTCEDSAGAMEAASGADLAQFRRWYSQAGTPRLEVEAQYDQPAAAFELKIRQATPPTPGQPEKLPFHIPLELALLDESGAPLALELAANSNARLTMLEDGGALAELRETETRLRFENLLGRPVPSLLRGFSAPVILESQADSDQLRFLMAHDRDPFSRWEAGQSYATRLMLKMIGRLDQGLALEPDAGLADAFARTLGDRDLDRAFVAQTLQLPAESYVGQQMAVIDVDRIHEVRAYLRRALGEALFERFDAVYRAQQTNEPYRFEAGAMGRRALKNLALAYLAASRRKAGLAAAEAQFEQADNMTDSIAALAQIVEHGEAATREAALSSFYQRWQDEGLVVDKWFVLQAVAQRPDSLPRVERLMAHPAFKMTNPNRVRSLIGAFAMGNPTGFHHASGDGYRFVADRVIELDRLNPQIAARLLGVFGRWQRYDAARQALMKAELERILAVPKLSRNSFEVASKSLG